MFSKFSHVVAYVRIFVLLRRNNIPFYVYTFYLFIHPLMNTWIAVTRYCRRCLKQQKCISSVLEARTLRSRCQQGWFLLQPLSLARQWSSSLCVLTWDFLCGDSLGLAAREKPASKERTERASQSTDPSLGTPIRVSTGLLSTPPHFHYSLMPTE